VAIVDRHVALFALGEGVELLQAGGQLPLDRGADRGVCGAWGQQHVGGLAGIADESLVAAGLCDNGVERRRRVAQHLVAGDEIVAIAEGVKMQQMHGQHAPLRLAPQLLELLGQQQAGGQVGDGVGHVLAVGALDGVAHAQADQIDIERPGDHIIGAFRQELVAAQGVAVIGDEHDRQMSQARVLAQAAEDLQAVGSPQCGGQQQDVGVAGGFLQGALRVAGDDHLRAALPEVSRQRLDHVGGGIHDQDASLVRHGSPPLKAPRHSLAGVTGKPQAQPGRQRSHRPPCPAGPWARHTPYGLSSSTADTRNCPAAASGALASASVVGSDGATSSGRRTLPSGRTDAVGGMAAVSSSRSCST